MLGWAAPVDVIGLWLLPADFKKVFQPSDIK
jgi:hypothetical protein